ncbi:tRNA pseudouridine synthase A, partial [Yersinia pestis PY-10]
MSGFELD